MGWRGARARGGAGDREEEEEEGEGGGGPPVPKLDYSGSEMVGAFGLLSSSQHAKNRKGSFGFALASAVSPFSRVGLIFCGGPKVMWGTGNMAADVTDVNGRD